MSTKTFKAYRIDPVAKRITTVQIREGVEDIYKEIGCNHVESGLFLGKGDILLVDADGWFKKTVRHCFGFNGLIFAGVGLIHGMDQTGATADAKIPELDVARDTGWAPAHMTKQELARMSYDLWRKRMPTEGADYVFTPTDISELCSVDTDEDTPNPTP